MPPGNCRGITVIVIFSKLYAMVLATRATVWAEYLKCRAKGGKQASERTSVPQIRHTSCRLWYSRPSKRSVNCIVAFWFSKRPLTWYLDTFLAYQLLTQLEKSLISTPLEEDPQHQTFSLQSACAADAAQIQAPNASSKTLMYSGIKEAYNYEHPALQH